MKARLFLVAALALVACQSQGKPPDVAKPAAPVVQKQQQTDVTAEDFAGWKYAHAKVTLHDTANKPILVDAEVASTGAQRTRGLMWRRTLPEGTGMVFLFDHPEYHSFWMKNCFIPLDLIFIGADMKIVGIVESAQPGDLTGRGPNAMSQFVLEVPGGWSGKVGVRAGSAVTFEGVEKIVPEE